MIQVAVPKTAPPYANGDPSSRVLAVKRK